MLKGKIIKGIGGFYYVETSNGVYECKARGNFRKQKISPLVGDNVEISVNEQSENRIESILDRKNVLTRPPLANLDQLFIVSSIVDPNINLFLIDKLIAISENKNIEPIMVFTKIDLSDKSEEYRNIYNKAGFKTILCNNLTGQGSDEIKELLKAKVSAFIGNTGVGKSSLLNAIDSSLSLKTGETSKKLGRGKHTTRHSELFRVCDGYVADTPGFSSLEFEKYEKILKNDLFDCFREFEPYFGQCKFSTCSHTIEKGCAICDAVNKGEIEKSRHNSYVQMYNEVKEIKEWELKR